MIWWDEVEQSEVWQNAIFDCLGASYAFVSAIALIQLVRIWLRVPEYGWTTQKVFHLLNFLVNGVRAGVFLLRRQVENLEPEILKFALLDIPGLLFFTTYTLLILFWAEIYYQALNLPTDDLRPLFLLINAVLYIIQACLWIYLWLYPDAVVGVFSKLFFAVVSLAAAVGFTLYGGRLFVMLRCFTVESNSKRRKLREVASVTTVCSTCFFIRCVMGIDVDHLYHPLLTATYYVLVEIVPSILVLFILRKLPQKPISGQYHAIS